jgi:hypothetical protein
VVRQPGAHKKKLSFITSVVIECGSLHISDGIVPVSRLLSNPKTFKRVSKPIVVGRDPISEFDDSLTSQKKTGYQLTEHIQKYYKTTLV